MPSKFAVTYRGMDGSVRRNFSRLAQVQEYCMARWEGVDYIDGPISFHNDYGCFTLTGCALADLGHRDPADVWTWIWRDLGEK
jgi:hypothetical protein